MRSPALAGEQAPTMRPWLVTELALAGAVLLALVNIVLLLLSL